MIWNIDLDDFNGQCPLSEGRRYPLMSLMKEILGDYTPPVTTQGPIVSTEETTTTQSTATEEVTDKTTDTTTTMTTGATNTPGGNLT